MATYYVRADGTVTSANRANATSPLSASTSLGLPNLGACVSGLLFADGDNIIFSGRGGQYNITMSPDNRIYLQGGVSSAINYSSDPDSPAVIDGGGAAGSGPLIYMSSASQLIYDFSGVKLQNWNNGQWGIYANNAIVKIHHVSGAVGSGNTYVEGIGAAIITVEDVMDFSGFNTHWVGLHDSSQLIMRRCAGIGGKVNAVHGIGTSSAKIYDTSVVSPAVSGDSAFLLQGTGENIIERCYITINKGGYEGVAHYNTATGASEVTVNNSIIEFIPPLASDVGVAFDVCNYTPTSGKITANKCTVFSKTKVNTGAYAYACRCNEGTPGTPGTIILNNTIIANLTYPFRLSQGGTIESTKNLIYNSGSNVFVGGLGVLTESGLIASDPKLVDISTGDVHLASDSPCIDAGIATGVTSDYAGNPIFGAIDIGAYEYQYTRSIAPITTPGPLGIDAPITGTVITSPLGPRFQAISTFTNNAEVDLATLVPTTQVRTGPRGTLVYSVELDAGEIVLADRVVGV